MELFLRIDLSIFCLLFTLVLVLGTRNRGDRAFLDYRLFMLMLGSSAVELAADTAMWFLDGSASPAGRTGLVASSLVYYLGHPLVPMLYSFYAAHQVLPSARRARSWFPFLAIPAAASALLSLATPFTGLYYYMDPAGVYHHGPLFLVFAAASYSYLLFAFVLVAVSARRKALERRTLFALLFFPIPPAIAGAFQMRYYGLVLIWPAIVLSLLVIYINIQQRKLSSDYLTGVFNRRRLDEYLETRVRESRAEARPAKRFAGFLADMDDFKLINDRCGHAAGDEALITAVRLVRSCLRSEDFLARYAGDEFVAIFPLSTEAELAQVVDRVRLRFAEHAPPDARYRLSLSIGAAVFDPELDADGDKFIERLDALMYKEKAAKKALGYIAWAGGRA